MIITTETQTAIRALRTSPFHPFAHYTHRFGHHVVAAHGETTLTALVEDPDVHVISMTLGHSHALAVWRRAVWETRHLGMPVARLDAFLCSNPLDRSCLTQLLERLREAWIHEGMGYVFTRLNAANMTGLHVLERGGFITVDNLLTFAMTDPGPQGIPENRDIELTPATPNDLPALRSIAAESFRFDRFHNDPLISADTADSMHAEWIENQVCHSLADQVIVAREGDRQLGFITCKIDRHAETCLGVRIGTIVLVAVDASAREQHIGRKLSFAAVDWFWSRNVSIIEVSTQSINVPASRTYLGTGFKYVCSATTLRLSTNRQGANHEN